MRKQTTICKKCGGSGELPMPGSMRMLRGKTGKSLRSIADKMGISASYLSDLERGNRQWDAELIARYKREVSAT